MASHENQIFVCFLTPNMRMDFLCAFVKVGKLLNHSCKSKRTKILSSESKFQWCSSTCVGKQEFVFQVKHYKHIVRVKKAHGEQLDFVESALS